MKIDIIEIDPHVIGVSNTLFGLPKNNNIRIFEREATKFVSEFSDSSSTAYDMIFLDCYDSNDMPSNLTSREFIIQLRQLLIFGKQSNQEEGLLLVNLLSGSPNFIPALKNFSQIFSSVRIFNVLNEGNVILIAHNKMEQKRNLQIPLLQKVISPLCIKIEEFQQKLRHFYLRTNLSNYEQLTRVVKQSFQKPPFYVDKKHIIHSLIC